MIVTVTDSATVMSLWTRLWNLLCASLGWLFWGIRIAQGVTWTLVVSPLRLLGLAFLGNANSSRLYCGPFPKVSTLEKRNPPPIQMMAAN